MTAWQWGFLVGYLTGMAVGWSVTVQVQSLLRELRRDRKPNVPARRGTPSPQMAGSESKEKA